MNTNLKKAIYELKCRLRTNPWNDAARKFDKEDSFEEDRKQNARFWLGFGYRGCFFIIVIIAFETKSSSKNP